ncbi:MULTISPECIES: acyl-homoserine-lactone synthase [unclassified Methylobacterium]|jgi:acyl-homoserine lactone synthase|uniref:acyl-homoserine-lactone synthase n=1 Tax=unclassified Methylobacterium TaxID=2615210 RepID=UPI001352E452|nr:acyl-homoserine-lactone synthase [Methylobacterium sp. 2A]MWV21096.1 GNAT family N-acetyltransferase [Methylobacterium sp. 2A]
MFSIISGDIEREYPAEFDRIYSFRHAYFVEELGWEACRRSDNRERDQFDGPGSIHVIGRDGGAIVSYARLLPTTRPHLLSHLYPELLQGATAPTGHRIYEWTRQSVLPQKRELSTANAFSNAFMGAVAHVAEALDLEGLLVQTHPALVGRLIETGWDVETLALPTLYAGALIVPVYARITARTLEAADSAFAAWPGSRLRIQGALPNGARAERARLVS